MTLVTNYLPVMYKLYSTVDAPRGEVVQFLPILGLASVWV